tara:strand:- start:49 stop:699 length:651 start_codon:yes stop_codon:yes gene_type:complete
MPQTLEELGSPEELAAMEDIGAPEEAPVVPVEAPVVPAIPNPTGPPTYTPDSHFKNKATVRNVRNNNLGNIKITADKWNGMRTNPLEKTFVTFDSPEHGIRAMNKVVDANLNATSSYETYVNRYASEPKEKARYKSNGKLDEHLFNYATQLANGQGIKTNTYKEYLADKGNSGWINKNPTKINKKEWVKSTALAEGDSKAFEYFTDDIIDRGLLLK